MGTTDFEIKLKKEAKTSLQLFKDQSLLRRKFGDDAVKLYDMIDSNRTAAGLIVALGMDEEKFIEMLEFMNNNGMVSVVQSGPGGAAPVPPLPPPTPSTVQTEGEEGEAQPSEEESDDGKIRQQPGRGEGPRKPSADQLLSPLEKILYEKYGSLGVQIYNLIDGEKTAEEILKETGVSEAKLVEILEFMDEQGIIKLEKPEERAEEVETEEEGAKKGAEPAREPRFKPILEEEPEETPFNPPKAPPKQPEVKKEEEKQEDIVLVDVPTLSKLSLMQRAVLFAELSTKFGKNGKQLMDLVDGKRDFVDLAISTGLSYFDIDAIMAYFGKKGFLSFRQLTRDEIKKKYGEDGFAIYKRAGRDGLLLYEMIGKEASLKEIILKSRIDPDRAIDIFMFIHKVLGLDIPLDRNVIYRQLGLKK